MEKLATDLTVSILLLSSAIFLGRLAAAVSESSRVGAQTSIGTPMHKVQLTQKGYIQFLRWELPVPEIHEFTFCLWLKSNDLEHPHSILSYSKNERERLIRSWISSRGRSIHLEINGAELFRRPVDVREHRWYHVCQSWENRVGRYALWLDGRLEVQGHSEQMIDRAIAGGGDIVLGQEYTDFDKGLEEGIEGSVLGFNLLLASAFDSLDYGYHQGPPSFRPSLVDPTEPRFPIIRQTRITKKRNPDLGTAGLGGLASSRYALSRNRSRGISRDNGTRAATSRAAISPPPSYPLSVAGDASSKGSKPPPTRRYAATFHGGHSAKELRVYGRSASEPLGLQLVKLSYVRCQLGKGSPPIGDSLMLISWSRTPVKVFGGATIKNVGDECGNF